jgi:hypothetical protein
MHQFTGPEKPMELSRVWKDDISVAVKQQLTQLNSPSQRQIYCSKGQYRNRIPPHHRRFEDPLRLHLTIRRDCSQDSSRCWRKHPV